MFMFYMPNLDNCTKPSPGIRVVPTIDDCGYQKKKKNQKPILPSSDIQLRFSICIWKCQITEPENLIPVNIHWYKIPKTHELIYGQKLFFFLKWALVSPWLFATLLSFAPKNLYPISNIFSYTQIYIWWVCPIYLGFAPVPNVTLVINFLVHSDLVN
jgi:hypothetical protein